MIILELSILACLVTLLYGKYPALMQRIHFNAMYKCLPILLRIVDRFKILHPLRLKRDLERKITELQEIKSFQSIKDIWLNEADYSNKNLIVQEFGETQRYRGNGNTSGFEQIHKKIGFKKHIKKIRNPKILFNVLPPLKNMPEEKQVKIPKKAKKSKPKDQ